MLLQFKVRGFKSFRDEVVFDMKKTKIKEFSNSILINNEDKALCSSVVYGPNASGKTTIFEAMDCLKEIVLRGNIENSIISEKRNYSSCVFELLPFAFSKETTPLGFLIEFIYKKVKYAYAMKIEVGTFYKKNNSRKILFEQLKVNNEVVFSREGNKISEVNFSPITKFLLTNFDETLAKQNIKISESNMSKTTLFLTSDFNTYISKKIVLNIVDWFSSYFLINLHSERLCFLPSIDEKRILKSNNLNSLLNEAGMHGSEIIYRKKDGKVYLESLVKGINDKEDLLLPVDVFESLGTRRFVNILPIIIETLNKGATLIMDEFDASLHPMLVMNIIKVFHNPDINVNNAQLIFNTHNPIYLDSKFFRRDEIKFVEKDKTTLISDLYSLSDFKTNGDVSVRKTTDYMKNYFINKYGAIEEIDLSDILTKIVKKNNTSKE